MPKVKGAHVLAAVKVLRANRDEALARLPPAVHKYLGEERILASVWYPWEDHIALLRCLGSMMGGDPWLLMGRGLARMDLHGQYKHYLRRDDPAQTLQLMTAMWKNVHDTGEVAVLRDDTRHATVRLRGFLPRSREICGICTGYLTESVMMSCDREPDVVHAACRDRGANECTWSVTWPAS
jgi:hypothetical protein